MPVPSTRVWLTWLPPVVVAVIVVLALGTRSDPGSDERPAGESTADEEASGTSPTTGFAQRVPILPDEPFSYTFDDTLPAHFQTNAIPGPEQRAVVDLDSTPPDNPLTDEGATLGRVLFYDVNLSINRTVRCASCHVQVHSFADPLTLSQGVGGFRTRRNSPGLANVAFNPSGRYLWDERAETLEFQMLEPFLNDREMALPLDELVRRVEEQAYYEDLFIDAFGSDDVTANRVAAALAQFVRAMVSTDSPYDRARAEVGSPLEPFPAFSDDENRGRELFFTTVADGGAGCSSCHTSEAQVTSPAGLKNNGLDPPVAEARAADLGAFEITGDPADLGSFRPPSLRNIAVTAPYMHDGRLPTLDAVLDHYSHGVQPHENLSPELRAITGPIRLDLDDDDRRALLAFLHTLTDEGFLSDERFAEPFRSSG